MDQRVTRVGVLGAGTMGAGIAQVAALAGCDVAVLDRDAAIVEQALERTRGHIARLAEKGRLAPADAEAASRRLRTARSAADLHDREFVVEAVFEDLAVKHEVLAAVEAAAPQAVFATNTSSLSVADIASGLRRRERLAGMHFFNPAPLMPLVEVIAADASDPRVVDLAFDTAQAWDKIAVRARDVPGFIVNRVARPFYLEALRLLGDGVAGVAQIDAAMRALGFRMGPFELMDLVGIDVNYAVSCSVYERLGNPPRLVPHDIQRLMRDAGTLGRKSGLGFYDYSAEPMRPVETRFALRPGRQARFEPLARCSDAGDACGQIQSQILLAIINEAGHALDERVATPADIDLAMRKGTNYPRGPLEWAADLGQHAVCERLLQLDELLPGRFTPARHWRP